MVFTCPNYKLIMVSLIHTVFGSCSYFYMSVLNPNEQKIKSLASESIFINYNHQLTPYQLAWAWSIVSGSLQVGCLIGALTLKLTLDHLGPRYTHMLVQNILILIGATMQGASQLLVSVELLIVGRLLIGIALMQTIAITVFLTECSPTEFRGIISALPTIGQKIWMVLGAFLGLPLWGLNWNVLVMYPIVPSFIHLLITPFVQQSPKYLYIAENDEQQAKDAIKFYHGSKADINKIKATFRQEAQGSVTKINFCTILNTRHLRWPLFLCVAAWLMFPLCGGDLAMLYSTGVMETIGISSQNSVLYTVFIVQLPGILASCVSMMFLEKWGRRPLLLLGSFLGVCGTTSLSLISPVSLLSPTLSNYIAVAAFTLSFLGYSIGPSVVAVLLAGELAPQSSRSMTLSIGGVVDWVFVITFVFAFPPLLQQIGSYAAMPIAILGAIVTLFLYLYLPETKGKDVGETVQIWKKRVIE